MALFRTRFVSLLYVAVEILSLIFATLIDSGLILLEYEKSRCDFSAAAPPRFK
jgi:hypothetical protein